MLSNVKIHIEMEMSSFAGVRDGRDGLAADRVMIQPVTVYQSSVGTGPQGQVLE